MGLRNYGAALIALTYGMLAEHRRRNDTRVNHVPIHALTFDPYAEQIAAASADDVGIAPAVILPLILDVLPRILACLRDRDLDPVTALTQASDEAINDDHRRTRLARRYWTRSRRSACPNLSWDQSLALADHTLAAGRTASAANLQSLTDLAMAMPKEMLS